jgi:hypothetical protein
MPAGVTSYQEMLRTLGTLLDQAGIKEATINLDAEGAHVTAPGWPWPRIWDCEAIEAQADAQQAWRHKPRPRRVRGAGRVTKRLRVVGAALDVDGQAPYLVMVDATVVRVEGRDGYRRSFEQRPLQRRLNLAEHLRGQISAF